METLRDALIARSQDELGVVALKQIFQEMGCKYPWIVCELRPKGLILLN